jgi:hypothetical protein
MSGAGAAAAGAAAPPAATLLVGGREVRLLDDAHFGALRAALGYDAWLSGALGAFDWGRMAAGGGKGGDKMARTPCKRLFVKEVSAGDHATLTHPGFLKARARILRSAPPQAARLHAAPRLAFVRGSALRSPQRALTRRRCTRRRRTWRACRAASR